MLSLHQPPAQVQPVVVDQGMARYYCSSYRNGLKGLLRELGENGSVEFDGSVYRVIDGTLIVTEQPSSNLVQEMAQFLSS